MPKYYRFRSLTPTRKQKRCRDKEITKTEADRNWLDSLTALTLACSPAPSWYLRRTSWRQSPSLMGLRTLRTSIHLGNRPIFVLKLWE